MSVRPDSWWYRTRKLIVRRRVEAASAAVAVVALVAGSGVAVWQARTATAERDFARRQLARSQAVNELNEFLLSDAAPIGQPFTAGQVLARAEQMLERQPSGSIDARVASLVTIGRQYAIQDDDDDARRVLEQAYDLSRASSDPAVRAQAGCASGRGAGRRRHRPASGDAAARGVRRTARHRALCARLGVLPAPGRQRRALRRHPGSEHRRTSRRHERCWRRRRSRRRSSTCGSPSISQSRTAWPAVLPKRVTQFARAWDKLREHGRDDTETAGTLLNNWALARSEQPLQAEPLLRRAIAIASADGSEASVSPMLLTNMGWSLLDLGRFAEGITTAERAGEAAEKSGAGAALFRNQLLRARLYLEAGDSRRAASALDEFERTAPALVPPGTSPSRCWKSCAAASPPLRDAERRRRRASSGPCRSPTRPGRTCGCCAGASSADGRCWRCTTGAPATPSPTPNARSPSRRKRSAPWHRP